jgi:hypothetical protein
LKNERRRKKQTWFLREKEAQVNPISEMEKMKNLWTLWIAPNQDNPIEGACSNHKDFELLPKNRDFSPVLHSTMT